VNVNIIENSGNGVGNKIVAANGRPGAVNINIIRGSGNGANNTIAIGNGR
jgi:hypothetical protein